MILIRFVIEWRGGWGKKYLQLTAVPRIGEYVILPGCGEMGLLITSVIHSIAHLTVKSRDFLSPTASTLEDMRREGWAIEGGPARE